METEFPRSGIFPPNGMHSPCPSPFPHPGCYSTVIPFFRGTEGLSVGFKIKPLKEAFFCVKTKTKLHFAVKFVKRSKKATIHFLFI